MPSTHQYFFSATIDPETGKKKFDKRGANNISKFLCLLLLLTRLGSLTFIYLKKHVIPAVAVLAVPSFISVLVIRIIIHCNFL